MGRGLGWKSSIYRKGNLQKGKAALDCHISDLDFATLMLLWERMNKVTLEIFPVTFWKSLLGEKGCSYTLPRELVEVPFLSHLRRHDIVRTHQTFQNNKEKTVQKENSPKGRAEDTASSNNSPNAIIDIFPSTILFQASRARLGNDIEQKEQRECALGVR